MKLLILPNINTVFVDLISANIDCSQMTNCKKIIWNGEKGLVLYYDETVTKLLTDVSEYDAIIQQHQAIVAAYDADQLDLHTRPDVVDHAFANFDYEWEFNSSDEVQQP
jgi:hypothetical protein